MRFVYADYVRPHHRDGLDQLVQQNISFPMPLISQPLIFFNLPLPFIHRVHVFVHYPEHS